MALADLRRSVPPPRKPKHTGSPEAWAAAEAALGITYPPDFKEYVGLYGSGTLGGVITVLNPLRVDWTAGPRRASPSPPLATLLETLSPFGAPEERWLYALASTLAVCEPYPGVSLPGRAGAVEVRLWPELPGLFPWAQGDAGQALLWWAEGAPEGWPVVLADPTEGLRSYGMDMSSLLAGWVSGALAMDALPPPVGRRFSQRDA